MKCQIQLVYYAHNLVLCSPVQYMILISVYVIPVIILIVAVLVVYRLVLSLIMEIMVVFRVVNTRRVYLRQIIKHNVNV